MREIFGIKLHPVHNPKHVYLVTKGQAYTPSIKGMAGVGDIIISFVEDKDCCFASQGDDNFWWYDRNRLVKLNIDLKQFLK